MRQSVICSSNSGSKRRRIMQQWTKGDIYNGCWVAEMKRKEVRDPRRANPTQIRGIASRYGPTPCVRTVRTDARRGGDKLIDPLEALKHRRKATRAHRPLQSQG